jgi:hypothetical protein
MAEGDGWKLGIEGTLYCGPSGSTPTTKLEGICSDLTLNLDPIKASARVREVAFNLTKVVAFDASIEFDMIRDSANTQWAAIWTAFTTRAPLAFKLEGAGGVKFDADFAIGITIKQPEGGFETATVSIWPAYHATHKPTFSPAESGGGGT